VPPIALNTESAANVSVMSRAYHGSFDRFLPSRRRRSLPLNGEGLEDYGSVW
jgi:hypothetical protein